MSTPPKSIIGLKMPPSPPPERSANDHSGMEINAGESDGNFRLGNGGYVAYKKPNYDHALFRHD